MAGAMLPAGLVAGGQGLPTVCSRHGNPAAGSLRVRFVSKPPGWTYLLSLVGMLPFLIVVLALRKTVDARTWPICAGCRSRRLRMRLAGYGTLALSLMLLILVVGWQSGSSSMTDDASGTTASSSGSGAGVALALLASVGIVVGYIVAAQGGAVPLTRGVVTGNGAWVEFRKPAAQFAEQVRTITAGLSPCAPGGYGSYDYGQPVSGQQPYGEQVHGQGEPPR